MCAFLLPSRALAAWVRAWWRNRHRCRHEDWSPLGGCPKCGQW